MPKNNKKLGRDNTVSNEKWSNVLKAAANTFAQLPSPEACVKRSKASSAQQRAAKEGRQ